MRSHRTSTWLNAVTLNRLVWNAILLAHILVVLIAGPGSPTL
jgi:hypothetical protein